MPIVSIVMPVYNSADYLCDSVGDILAQTFKDFELICVDDGSTDESGSLLDDYALSDSRIRVIHQENRGGGAARNRGLEASTGKYLLFLDADDRFDNKLLEVVLNKAEESGCDIVVYDVDTFDFCSGQIKPAPWIITDIEVNDDNPFTSFNNSVWNKLFLKDLIDRNGIRFTERRAAYSTAFVVSAVFSAKKIRIVRNVLLHYRFNNPNSNVSNEDKDSKAIVTALLDVKKFLISNGLYNEKKDVYLYLCEKELITRLSFMKTAKGYRELYTAIHDGQKELFGPNDTSESLMKKGLVKLYEICLFDIDEWLFRQLNIIRERKILEKPTFFMPQFSNGESVKIAIYGAGNVGKDFFIQSMRRSDVEIVGWVDKNYKSIGFPVQPPDTLLNSDYDFVVIAVSDRMTADSIIESLVEHGIARDKLFYEVPEFV